MADKEKRNAKSQVSQAVAGLTPFGRSVSMAGVALLFLGLILGSYPYLLCALLLLASAFVARGLPDAELLLERGLSRVDVRTGEPLDVDVRLVNHGPPVGITVHDKVPEPFLLEGGSNFGAAFLAEGDEAWLDFRLRAPRRGTHALQPGRVTVHDPSFLQAARVMDAGGVDEVVVHPRTTPVPRVRTRSAWGRAHMPGGDRAVRGILTNDFRELRPYQRGDPLKQVNWKATARQSRDDDLTLIVNDYEVEGKKTVWIFVDASPYTVGGTNVESVFDELAGGALAVAAHYLDMGHRVGFTLFGAGQTRLLYPDVGELQERRIQAALATATPGEKGERFAEAVEASKGFLAREKPLIFVFTLAGRDPGLSRAIVSARAIASTGRRAAPVIAVTPIVPDDGSLAARVVAIHEKAQLKGLERRGVSIVRYDPTTTPLSALLARGVIG